MHDSAYYELGRMFFELYWRDTFSRVLEVGARDVNGSVRDFCPPNADYIGVALDAGRALTTFSTTLRNCHSTATRLTS